MSINKTTLLKPAGVSELARILKIHPSSVSRALSGKSGVSEILRSKVLTAAKGMHYSPNPHASSLRRSCGEGLVLITAYDQSRIAMLRNDALVSLARPGFGGVRVIVRSPEESLETVLRSAVAYYPRAIVVADGGRNSAISPAMRRELAARCIPVVSMDRLIDGVDAVVIRRWVGTYQATRLLFLSGCRNPVFLSSASLSHPDERLKGIIAAFRSLNRELTPGALFAIPAGLNPGFDFGHQATQELLSSRPFDGLFCYNDEIAIGALKALTDARVRVPDEIRLVGFDNLPLTAFVTPQLSSVAQPVSEVAQAVLNLIERRLANPGLPSQVESFETRLVIRESATPASREALADVFRTADEPRHDTDPA